MAEKNEKLMPRGLIPSSPEVLAAAKKYTVPESPALAVRLVLLGE